MDGTRVLHWFSRLPPLALAGAVGSIVALWGGLLLAELGHFTAWPLLALTVLVTGCTWRHLTKRQQDVGRDSTGHNGGLAAACVLALVALAFVLPPSEFLLGGWDPGVYLHTASALSRTGALLQHTPDLAALDAECRLLIGRQGQDAWEPFLGMRMLPDGRLSPQFYHLYPVLMALAWPLGGIGAALMINPLLYALSIILLYLWACRWVRPRWAFAAALLLALNPAQVWQAGFATAELLAQCLLLIGLVATDRALSGKNKDPINALTAGAAFGLMLLTKYEAILFVVPFALVLLIGLHDRAQRRTLILLLGTIAALGAHAGMHQIFFAPLYHPMGNWVLPGLVTAGIVALLLTTVTLLRPHRTTGKPPATATWLLGLRLAAVAGFAAWVFLAWYVRPRLTVEGRVLTLFTNLIPGAHDTAWFAFVAGRNARNFWYLQSLFGSLGLVAAVVGLGLLIARKWTIWKTAWLAASLCVLLALMTQISHESFMMFVARRMVPVILPLLCLGVAALCDRTEWMLHKHPRRGVLAGVLFLGLSLAGTLGGTVFLARQQEWPGLHAWLDQVAAEIPHGAIVYSDAPGFAAPLRFLYGIPAYEVRTLAPGLQTDPMPMMLHSAEQHTAFWLSFAAIPEAYAAYAAPTASLPLNSLILGTTRHWVPRYLRPRGGCFTLYRIMPRVAPTDI